MRRPTPGTDGSLSSRPGGPPGPLLPPGRHQLGGGGQLAVGSRSGPQPLLVFLHGAGGSAADSLARVGGPAGSQGVHVLATTSEAATWDLLAGALGPDVTALDAALAQAYEGLEVARTAIGGFSDGGSYALSLGLANGDLFDAVLAFSPGFAAAPRRQGRPRVWISHGTADRVLPVDRCGRRVARDLTGAGYAVTYDEFDGGHEVPERAVTDALRWWRET